MIETWPELVDNSTLKETLLYRSSMCREKVKIKLFTTYCSQFYCAHLWQFREFEKSYRKVKGAYNNVFRFFLRLPRDPEG